MQIPDSIRCDPSERDSALEEINRFFSSLEQEVKKTNGEGPYFERRCQGIHHLPHTVPTDDMIHTLRYKDDVIGVVSETRTDSNYIRFNFFRYSRIEQ